MSACPANDKTLLTRLLQSEEAAFIEIYERYWHRLFLSAYRRVKDKADAEELVQNLFLKLWEKRQSLRIENLENYLFSAIRHQTIDFLNKQMVAGRYLQYQKIFKAIGCSDTEDTVRYRELENALENGLKALPEKSEKVFRLYKLDNWSIEKIAGHLHLSEKTVHYHLTKSLKSIRHYLQEFTLSLLILLF